jgi:hypothetical protein
MDIEEEIQIKGIDNLLNNTTAENFPNLEEKRDIQVQEAFSTAKQIGSEKKQPQIY